MAVKKNQLSKPLKATAGLNFKVRSEKKVIPNKKGVSKKTGPLAYFVCGRNRKKEGGPYKSHLFAIEEAKALDAAAKGLA